MNNDPIERAARAFVLVGSGIDEWDTLDAETQDRLKDAVRAALGTLRDPGASVLRSGARKAEGIHRSKAVQAKVLWQAMIDAALAGH